MGRASTSNPTVTSTTNSVVPAADPVGVAPVVSDTEPLPAILARVRRDQLARRYSQAIAGCERILARAPAGSPERRSALVRRGWARYKTGALPGALADYDAVALLDPPSASVHYDRARIRAKAKDYLGARQDFDRAIAINPGYASAWMGRSRFRRDRGDYLGAERDICVSIDLNPKNGRAWADRGFNRRALKRYPAAIVDYDRALILEPTLAYIRIGRAAVLRMAGYLERAAQDLDWVIENSSKQVYRAYSHRALLRLAQGNPQAAAADADKAIEIKANDALAHCFRGDVHREQGEFEAALRSYAVAIRLLPTYEAPVAGRGLVRLRQGYTALAKKDLERALATMPHWESVYDFAARALAGLK